MRLKQSLITLAILLLAAFTGPAIWFQIEGAFRWLALATLAVGAGAVLVLVSARRFAAASVVVLCALLAVMLWWRSIEPSNNRDWAEEVSRGVTATIEGNNATLDNIRAFKWRSETDFTPHWERRRYALDALSSVDLVTSVWASSAIAHTLVSFGFKDGSHVVFSAEIRRERDEAFSELGGLFKKFELVLIAAQEQDILKLRADIRRESVSIFALKLEPPVARALFLAYLAKGNALAATPEFYQTITTNCTTVIYELAHLIEPGTPWDWRILVSGYLPSYLYDHRLIATDEPLGAILAQAMISPTEGSREDNEDYSARIRSKTR